MEKIKISEETMREYKFHKIVQVSRYVSSFGLLLSTYPISKLVIESAKLSRENPNLVGGEMLVPVCLLILVYLLFPKYSLVTISELANQYSRFSLSHVDIDINESGTYTSDNGAFDLVDHDGVHHMIQLVKSRGNY